jgi:hypothetical protein
MAMKLASTALEPIIVSGGIRDCPARSLSSAAFSESNGLASRRAQYPDATVGCKRLVSTSEKCDSAVCDLRQRLDYEFFLD